MQSCYQYQCVVYLFTDNVVAEKVIDLTAIVMHTKSLTNNTASIHVSFKVK